MADFPARDGHTLALTLEDGSVGSTLACPHDGAEFADVESAPVCRVFLLEEGGSERALSRHCLAANAYGEEGADCLVTSCDAGSGVSVWRRFPVTALPVYVEFWWENGDEFFVRPYLPDAEREVASG